MERKILFQEIENICSFDTSRSLLDRIRDVLGISEKEKVKPIACPVEMEQEKRKSIEDDKKQNIFCIEKSNKVIDIQSEKDACFYRWNIGKTDELKAFIQKYDGNEIVEEWTKPIKRLLEEIRKSMPSYEQDRDNSEKFAKYVCDKILNKHIKMISRICYREIHRDNTENKFFIELIKEINTYLEKLGVYTVLAQPGSDYNDVINDYEPICDTRQGSIQNPVIVNVEYPAYRIDYVDEDGELQSFCMSGQCILGGKGSVKIL